MNPVSAENLNFLGRAYFLTPTHRISSQLHNYTARSRLVSSRTDANSPIDHSSHGRTDNSRTTDRSSNRDIDDVPSTHDARGGRGHDRDPAHKSRLDSARQVLFQRLPAIRIASVPLTYLPPFSYPLDGSLFEQVSAAAT